MADGLNPRKILTIDINIPLLSTNFIVSLSLSFSLKIRTRQIHATVRINLHSRSLFFQKIQNNRRRVEFLRSDFAKRSTTDRRFLRVEPWPITGYYIATRYNIGSCM